MPMIIVPKLSEAQRHYWLLKEKLPHWPSTRNPWPQDAKKK